MASQYLKTIQQNQIKPNFWVSEEYFQKAKFFESEESGWLIVEGPFDEGDKLVLPPLKKDAGIHDLPDILSDAEVWSDFDGYPITKGLPRFLDLEFIYDPINFLNMSGGKWQVFRKNSRKFPKRFPSTTYLSCSNAIGQKIILESFFEWLKGRDANEEIQDDETIEQYLKNGEHRKVLINNDSGKVLGINIWDLNDTYINYRYCFCSNEPFLSEYMRLLFYTDPEILSTGKLVNDGGCLGNDNLKAFKMKLNPISVREVSSYRIV